MTGEISRGSPDIRVTVIRIDKPRGTAKVGDWFEVRGSRMILPPGQAFCPYALSVVLPIVTMRQNDLPADNWLVRKPFICGPDAEENLVMKVEPIYEETV